MYHLFFEGDDYYKSLLADLESASSLIEIEVYIFRDDAIGSRVIEVLRNKARDGVKVRLILDGVGSFKFVNFGLHRLKEPGIELFVFRPVNFLNFYHASIRRRDHRKIIVIDRKISYLGGMNITCDHSREYSGELAWRDTAIRLVGDISHGAGLLFESLFKFLQNKRRLNELKRDYLRFNGFELITNVTLKKRREFRRRYLNSLKLASRSIKIEMGYFVPPRSIVRVLKRQARRGLEVTLILSEQSDVPATLWAGKALFSTLLKSGVKIYIFQKRFLHAKTTIIDRRRAYTGSRNLDYLSLTKNLEIDVYIERQETCRDLDRQFTEDLNYCRNLDLFSWSKRPCYSRILERFFYMFRYYL